MAMFTNNAKTSGYSFSSLSITALNAAGSLMPCATKLETLLEIIFATLLISVIIVLVLVDGEKVALRMKKRKNFFQVFSFSFILQGFQGKKIVVGYHFGAVNDMVTSITKP